MPKPEKNTYLDFVKLTTNEYNKLIEQLGKQAVQEIITDLNNYIGSKGKRYKSHYFTILAWSRRAKKKIRLFPITGKTCSERDCKLPAVYKDSSGAYDIFKCSGHMPEKVKKLYY